MQDNPHNVNGAQLVDSEQWNIWSRFFPSKFFSSHICISAVCVPIEFFILTMHTPCVFVCVWHVTARNIFKCPPTGDYGNMNCVVDFDSLFLSFDFWFIIIILEWNPFGVYMCVMWSYTCLPERCDDVEQMLKIDNSLTQNRHTNGTPQNSHFICVCVGLFGWHEQTKKV